MTDSTLIVTVLLPVHNGALSLRDAVDSVLAQTFQDYELLIVEDGSTDGSMDIVASYADARIRVIKNERNLGLIASLNKGLEAARGTFIARMDCDDRMHPTRLERQMQAMQADPGVAVLSTTVDLINADGEVYGTWDTDRASITEDAIRTKMPRTNCIAHPSVLIRRSSLGKLRYANEQQGAEDWDLWMRMLSRGQRIAKLNEPLLQYRVHQGSIMAGSKRQVSLERRLLRTRSRYLLGELVSFHLNVFNARVAWAQVRTVARAFRLWLSAKGRDMKRRLTCSPFALVRERILLSRVLAEWKGHHLFLFPYMNTGGAEKVHADIVASVADQAPLVLICGYSTDYGTEQRFRKLARTVEVPRLLNHPSTRKKAERLIADHLNSKRSPVLFSSLTTTFFELLPSLKPHVRRYWLQHAFLYQPTGNNQHKAWLPQYSAVDGYCFVSDQAMREFRSFLFANAIPHSAMDKLRFMPNAVTHSSPPVERQGPIGILFVGRESPEKRPELFVQLAERLTRALPGVFRFTAAGVLPRDNTAGIHFTGRITDDKALSALYADHDILVLTSDREGFPMVIMEAMVHGLAIASTPVGDVPNRTSSTFAFLTSSIEATAVVDELTAFVRDIVNDRDRLWTMRQAAFEQAKAEFDPEAFRERYRALLTSPAAST